MYTYIHTYIYACMYRTSVDPSLHQREKKNVRGKKNMHKGGKKCIIDQREIYI